MGNYLESAVWTMVICKWKMKSGGVGEQHKEGKGKSDK